MNPSRAKWVAVTILAVLAGAAAPAQAKLYQDVIRGLELFGYRFSGQRNLLGDGWDFNATGVLDNQQFKLGFADLTVDGGLVGNVGYTLRGIPSINLSVASQRVVIDAGTARLVGGPLSYDLVFNVGLQNTSVTGSALVNTSTELNLIGFYDQTFQISNRGQVETSGILGEQIRALDYDVGPIDLSGNIYLDALAAVTQPFYDATQTENPFAKLSPRAMRVASMTESVEELRARVAAGDILSDEEMARLISDSILLNMLNPESGVGSLEGLVGGDNLLEPQGDENSSPQIDSLMPRNQVPEPPTLALVALGIIGLRCSRTRRGHLSL